MIFFLIIYFLKLFVNCKQQETIMKNSSINKFVALYLFHQLKDKGFNLKNVFPSSVSDQDGQGVDIACSCPLLLFTNCEDNIYQQIFKKKF